MARCVGQAATFRRQIDCNIIRCRSRERCQSTFAKQIKLLHLDGFSDKERRSYRPIIYSNLILGIKQVILAAKQFDLPLDAKARRAARHLIDNFFIFPEDEPLGSDITHDLHTVWSDKAIASAFVRRGEYELLDNAAYYFAHLERVCSDAYVPSDEDILHSRQRTRGIIETVYTANRTPFRMVDVGGQRNERGKWIHWHVVAARTRTHTHTHTHTHGHAQFRTCVGHSVLRIAVRVQPAARGGPEHQPHARVAQSLAGHLPLPLVRQHRFRALSQQA